MRGSLHTLNQREMLWWGFLFKNCNVSLTFLIAYSSLSAAGSQEAMSHLTGRWQFWLWDTQHSQACWRMVMGASPKVPKDLDRPAILGGPCLMSVK